MGKKLLVIICAVCLAASLAGCKAEDEIVNVPTPKIEQQTVVLEREKSAPEHYFEVTGNGEIIAAPDFATITLRVSGAGETAEEASGVCQEARAVHRFYRGSAEADCCRSLSAHSEA